MGIKMYIEKKVSKKTGKTYVAIWADLGEREIIVTMDRNVIMSLADLSPRGLDALEVDTPLYI